MQLRDLNVSANPTVVDDVIDDRMHSRPGSVDDVADEGAKALCRACPLRWRCAQEACVTPGAEGVWAGILIPEAGRARRFALKQLRSLAEQNGYPVRKTG